MEKRSHDACALPPRIYPAADPAVRLPLVGAAMKQLNRVWTLHLYETPQGDHVCKIIDARGHTVKADGRLPNQAYRRAEAQLAVKPAFFLPSQSDAATKHG